MRAISASAVAGSGLVQKTSVATAVSKLAVGLGQDKLGDGIRIELDVDPGTGADFQGPSARPYQQCAAPSA
jgi:hypothetical protein